MLQESELTRIFSVEFEQDLAGLKINNPDFCICGEKNFSNDRAVSKAVFKIMKPDDKHKKKATRQWQAKNGIVAPKLSKQQKDKERVKQLQSNWDR